MNAIGGHFAAGEHIGTVRSGGAVTAQLNAPVVGAVIEHDASIFEQYEYPDVPDSIIDELLADAQAAIARAHTARDQARDAADLARDAARAARDEALGQLAQARDETLGDRDRAVAEALAQYEKRVDEVEKGLARQRAAVAEEEAALRAAAHRDRAAYEQLVEEMIEEGERQFAAAVREAARQVAETQRLQEAREQAKAATEEAYLEEMARARDWVAQVGQQVMDFVNAFTAQGQAERWQGEYAHLMELTEYMPYWERVYTVGGGLLGDAVGLRALVAGWTGEDPYTLRPLGPWERIFQFTTGGLTLVTTAMGISAFMSRIVSPCASWHWAKCFTGEVEVVVAEAPAGTVSQVMVAAGGGGNGRLWFTITAAALAGTALLPRRRRPRTPHGHQSTPHRPLCGAAHRKTCQWERRRARKGPMAWQGFTRSHTAQGPVPRSAPASALNQRGESPRQSVVCAL